jgi:hypothetical protein
MVMFKIETMSSSAVSDHMALARTTYDDPVATNADHFWWKHGTGTGGPSISVNVFDGTTLVGRSVVQKRKFWIDDKTVLGAGVIVDLILAPKYRTVANFLSLARSQSDVPDVDVILHTSNATSDPLYQKLLHYPVACRLAAYGLPLRAAGILQKMIGRTIPAVDVLTMPWRGALRLAATLFRMASGIRVEIALPSANELERIMRSFGGFAGPHLTRDRAFLEWRFLKGPVSNGTVGTIWSGKQVRGYTAWRKVTFMGIRFLVVMDLILDVQLTLLQRLALRLDLVDRARKEGTDIVFVMMNLENSLSLNLCRFPLVQIADSFLPHATPIFVHPRHASLKWLQQHKSLFITLADLDYF